VVTKVPLLHAGGSGTLGVTTAAAVQGDSIPAYLRAVLLGQHKEAEAAAAARAGARTPQGSSSRSAWAWREALEAATCLALCYLWCCWALWW